MTGFIYGAVSTKFWMQRQGIMELIVTRRGNDDIAIHEMEDNMPFFAW